MTGGRLTRGSNDYTVGYARARRDLGCRYTLGFYDRKPEADKRHVVTVEGKRPGLRLHYASRYTFPSKQERRKMSVEAAYLVPKQFEGGGLRAHLFPVQPTAAKTWNAILAVDFPVAFAGATSASTREFGVVLRRGPDVVHTFHRSIALERARDGQAGAPRVTFVEPVTLPAGRFALTAVLIDPSGEKPFGAAIELTVPPVPAREAILAGPILGRRRGNDVVVYGGGDARGAAGDRVGDRDDFRPLIIAEVDRAEPLAALTHACVVRPKAKDGPWSIARGLETGEGVAAGSLANVALRAPARARVHCERLLDEIPVPQLKPGKYTFRAVIAGVGKELSHDVEATAPFEVTGE